MSSETILAQLLAQIPDTYQKTIGFPTHDILSATAIRLAETEALIQEARRKLDPENLSGEELDRYIYPRSGLARKQATFAEGVIHLTGTGFVNEGALFTSSGGVPFVSVEPVYITGEGDIPVVCRQDGAVGNLPAHAVNQMPVTIQGITACDNREPMTGGFPEETDAEYYARHLIKIQTPPTSGNIYHYMMWALEIEGVKRAKVFPLGHGDNTVDVVIADSYGRPAEESLVKAVQDYIDPGSTGEGYGQAPIGARCFVSAATPKPISLSLIVSKLSSDNEAAVTRAIQNAVGQYFAEIAFVQNYLSYARVLDAALSAEGVLDLSRLRLNGGTDDISVGVRECAVLGEVDIRYVSS